MKKFVSTAADTLNTICERQTPAAVAHRFGLETRLLRKYRSGERRPPASLIAKLERELGIPLAAWDTPAPPPGRPSGASRLPAAPVAGRVPVDVAEGDASTEERVSALMLEVVAALREARSSGASLLHRASVLGQARGVLQLWARVRGETGVGMQALLRAPAWTRAIGIVMQAAEAYPDAHRALVLALAELESES